MNRPFAVLVGRQLRTSTGKADSRKKLIAAVRAAANRLGLGDDDRRAIQGEETGKASLADMTLGEMGKVLDRLNRDRPAPMAHRAHIGKIKALWWSLYWLGAVEAPGDVALDAFVRRQTGLASLRFVDFRKAPALIEAMKAMATRAGVTWWTEKRVADFASSRPDWKFDQAAADRLAVLGAVCEKLSDLRLIGQAGAANYLRGAMALDRPLEAWSSHELDAAIRLLGKRLRRAMDKSPVE